MKTIQPAELQKIVSAQPGTALLDVRTPVEFAQAHVPTAQNIPLDQLDPKALVASGTLPQDQPVYILCRSGGRAGKAASQFASQGLTNAIVVEGGTQAWIEAGFPVDRGTSNVISLERQVRIAAGALVVTGLLLAWLIHPLSLIHI